MGKYRQAGVLNFNVRHRIALNKGPKLARPLRCFLFSITAGEHLWLTQSQLTCEWMPIVPDHTEDKRQVWRVLHLAPSEVVSVFLAGKWQTFRFFYYKSHLFVSTEMWSEKTLKYERLALNLEPDPTAPDLIQNLASFGPLCWDGVLTQQLNFSSLVKNKEFIGKITRTWVVWALLSGEAPTAHRFKPCWQ